MGTYIPLDEHRPELTLPGLFQELQKRSPRCLDMRRMHWEDLWKEPWIKKDDFWCSTSPAKTCSKFSYQAKELLNFWYHHRKEWYRILHLTPVTIKFQQKLRKKGVCFPENSLKCEVLNAVFPQSSQRYADVSSHYSSLHSADGILLRLTLSKGKL